MARLLSFLIFLGLFLTLVGSAHYYLWARFVRDVGLSPTLDHAATLALTLLFLSLPTTMLISRRMSPGLGRVVLLPSYVWLGILFLATTTLLGFDAVRGLWAITSTVLGASSDADLALAQRALGSTAAVVTLGLAAFSLWSGRAAPAVLNVEVPLRRLPRALDGTTIVQLSDVHIGPTIGREFLDSVVKRVNALKPDLVAITGDLVDGDVDTLAESIAPLSGLESRHGTFFVTGNHEFYSGADAWCAKLRTLGVRVLRNEHVTIRQGEAAFDLAGIEDYTSGRFDAGRASDVGVAVEGRDPERELVLLAHQPKSVFEAQRHGVGLQLSGHTHGGQIWPFNYLVKLAQPVVAGLSRFGDTYLYVSRGTGYWGPPMRLGAPAEITRLTLRSA